MALLICNVLQEKGVSRCTCSGHHHLRYESSSNIAYRKVLKALRTIDCSKCMRDGAGAELLQALIPYFMALLICPCFISDLQT